MATTWESYRGDIRLELKDPNATKWGDDELRLYYNSAMKNYSQYFPQQKTNDYTPVANTRTYDLPTDIMSPVSDAIVSLEYPENHWVAPLMAPSFKPGTYREVYNWLNESVYIGAGLRYYAWGSSLFLTTDPEFLDADEVFQLRYFGIHDLVSIPTDELSIPLVDEELIIWYVTAKAYQRISGQDANLQRWDERGRRNDSPLIPEHVWRMQMYQEGIRQRRKPEHKRLTRKMR